MLLNRFKKFFLIFGDLILLYASLYLTLLLRYRQIPSPEHWNQHFLPFTVLFIVWVIIYYINGLYDIAASKNDVEFYNKILRNVLINFGIATAYFYLLTDKLFDIKPQTVFFIFMAVYLGIFSLWRFWYNSLVQRPNFLRNVLVVGMNDEARELIKEIIKKPQLGYRITMIMHDGYRDSGEFGNAKICDSAADIKKMLGEHAITTVLTVMDPHTNPQIVQRLYETLSMKLQFFDLPSFYEKLTGKIPVTNIGYIWFLENLAESEKGIYEALKRLVDILFSVTILLVFLPFWPLVAVGIKMSSRGSIFFRQTRIGYLGRRFNAVKFRSMVEDAEKNGEAQWAQKNDPRVTKFGRFLRSTRIDEIPQLLNVLRGEMSLIGPRPERPEFVRKLQEIIPFYNERNLVKPGLTGWAQINFQYGASAGDALKKLQYDLFYIKNRSIPLDLGILLKTINIMLSGRGQ